jgi:hypothetical protein
MLNNMSSQYINVIFFSQAITFLYSRRYDHCSVVEEKRTIVGEIEGNSQLDMELYSRNNRSRSTKYKGEVKCYYCKKMGHTTWNCIFQANDILKGKVE